MSGTYNTEFSDDAASVKFKIQNMFPKMDSKFMSTLNSKFDERTGEPKNRRQYTKEYAPFSKILIKHHGQDDACIEHESSINTGQTGEQAPAAQEFLGSEFRQASDFSPFDFQWPQATKIRQAKRGLKIQNGAAQLRSIEKVTNLNEGQIEMNKSPFHRRGSHLSSNSPVNNQRNVFSAGMPKRITQLRQTKQKDKENAKGELSKEQLAKDTGRKNQNKQFFQ